MPMLMRDREVLRSIQESAIADSGWLIFRVNLSAMAGKNWDPEALQTAMPPSYIKGSAADETSLLDIIHRKKQSLINLNRLLVYLSR